jgi:ketosteroid isomerase-like protein
MTPQDAVRAVSAAWDEALLGTTASVIAAFMTDEWVYVGPTGVTSKADLVGWIASGRLAHYSMAVVGEPRVVPAADTMIVTARKASSGTWDGVPYTADEWISEVYVRAGGTWRCAFSQKADARS